MLRSYSRVLSGLEFLTSCCLLCHSLVANRLLLWLLCCWLIWQSWVGCVTDSSFVARVWFECVTLMDKVITVVAGISSWIWLIWMAIVAGREIACRSLNCCWSWWWKGITIIAIEIILCLVHRRYFLLLDFIVQLITIVSHAVFLIVI